MKGNSTLSLSLTFSLFFSYSLSLSLSLSPSLSHSLREWQEAYPLLELELLEECGELRRSQDRVAELRIRNVPWFQGGGDK